jgi:transport family protein 27
MLDSSGHDLYSDHIQQHWSHPNMLCLVYDVTNKQSFDNCNKWLERTRAQPPDQPYPGVLVANKTDLDKRRVVSEADGQSFATAKKLTYFESSSVPISFFNYSVNQLICVFLQKITESCTAPFLYLVTEYHNLYEEKLEIMKSVV